MNSLVRPLVRMEGVRVVRDGRAILTVDSLEVGRSEILGLVGPNGSGKTTLLKVIGMVLTPDAGTVEFDGRRVRAGHLDDTALVAARRRVTMVFQNPTLLSRTVFENVSLGLRFRGLPRAEVKRRTQDWLERLGIAGLARRLPRSLSGGEARRAALARAMVLEPELLLLDEPMANLDWPTRSQLISDLRGILREMGASAVVVTHDVHEAPHFADRLLVMSGGRITQAGPPADVLGHPVDVETAAFLGYESFVPAALLGQDSEVSGLGGTSGDWFCLRANQVEVLPVSAGETAGGVAETAAGRMTRGSSQGVVEVSAKVVGLAPWGPAFSVRARLSGAAGNMIAGICAAEHVVAGAISEGQVALVRLDLRAAARLKVDQKELARLAGLEPALPAPEAGALSAEL